MKKRDVLLLVDYKEQFYCPFPRSDTTMDLARFARLLGDRGYGLQVAEFPDVDFKKRSYRGLPVVYQSSEDFDLFYKSYIEDVVLGLELAGAMVIPSYTRLRAHHNKVFMEILRDVSDEPALKTIGSTYYGTLEDFARRAPGLRYPAVLKEAASCQSRGVALVRDPGEALRAAERASRTFNAKYLYRNVWNPLIGKEHRRISQHRRKFVVQDFVPALDHDYKVRVFGDRVFVRKRWTPPNDFRASGSGVGEHPETVSTGLLDLAMRVRELFDVPYASIDLLEEGERFHVSELQFLRFGIGGLKHAPWYWTRDGSGWARVATCAEVEDEFALALASYLDEHLGERGA